MDEQENAPTPAKPTTVWGDAVMPAAAAQRRARMNQLHAHDGAADATTPPATDNQPAQADSTSPVAEPLLDVGGRPVSPDDGPNPPYTAPLPQTDALEGNWAPLLGPGNEAMADGASPAPRGYTGGAMGRVVSGLSPSFPEAASGAPPESPAPDPAATPDALATGHDQTATDR